MTDIVNNNYFEPVVDQRYDIGKNKIPCDGSSQKISISRHSAYNPSSVVGNFGIVYNQANKLCKFRLPVNEDTYFNPAGCSLKLQCYAYSAAIANPTVQIPLQAGMTIDWDTAGALIQDIYVYVNDSSKMCYKYTGDMYKIKSKVRMGLEKSYTYVNNSDDIFFQPCCDDTSRDTLSLSTNSTARRANFTTVGTYYIHQTKILPLGYLCELFNTTAFLRLKELEIHILFRDHGSVLYGNSGVVNYNYCDIENAEFIMENIQMTPEQLKLDMKLNEPQKLAYINYDITKTSYLPSQKYELENITNLQGLVLAFPSTTDGTGTNPTEFILNGMTGWNITYNNKLIFDNQIALTSTATTNTELYYVYKKLAKREMASNFVPCFDLYNMTTANDAVLFCSPIYESDLITLSNGTSNKGRIEITTQSSLASTTISTLYIIKLRANFVQINVDGSISLIES